MAVKKIGAGISLDGEKEFKRAISDINKDLKVLGSEMGKVTAEFSDNSKSVESLTAKQKVYNKQIDEQKKKLQTLKSALESSAKEFGDNDNKTKSWQISVNRATAELSKMESELRKTEAALNANASSAQKYEEQMKKFQSMGESLSSAGKTMSIAVTAPLVAASALSFKLAAEMQDAMGATNQIFKNSSDAVQVWAQNLESYYGIASGEALEYANMMGSMLRNIGGLTEREAANQAQTLIELAGDLTAMYGGTTQDAVRALTGALKGNNTMLDNYGMAVNDAMIKTKALEMGIYSGTGQMDLMTKQAATLALIMEQSGAAQGQAGREAEGASGAMRAFTTEVKNLSTSVGDILLPVITPMISGINETIQSFNDLSPATKETIVSIAGVAAAIGPVLIVGGKVITVIGTFSGALALLHGSTMVATPAMAGLATIIKIFTGTTVASTAATTASTAATTASTLATKLATIAQGAFNLIMTVNPVFLVVAGLTALGVALYIVIKHWKEITEWIGKAWDALKKWNNTKAKEVGNPYMDTLKNLQGPKGYASGTNSASPGLHWVGEYGPELVNFRGGESVLNAIKSAQLAASTRLSNQAAANTAPQVRRYTLNLVTNLNGRQIAKTIYEFTDEQGSLLGVNLVEG